MKKVTLFLALVSFVMSSCNMTDYQAALSDNISAWNTYSGKITSIVQQVYDTEDKANFSQLKLHTDALKEGLDKRIAEVSADKTSDEDVKKLNEALLDYLKAGRTIVDDCVIPLYTNGANMTDEEVASMLAKTESLYDELDKKIDGLREVQNSFASKHNIKIQEY